MNKFASVLAGILLGALGACIALPMGVSPAILFMLACSVVFLTSLGSFVVLSLNGWPRITEGAFSVYELQRVTVGFGCALAFVGIVSAAIDKITVLFDLSPLEAGLSATLGVGGYALACAWFFSYAMRILR